METEHSARRGEHKRCDKQHQNFARWRRRGRCMAPPQESQADAEDGHCDDTDRNGTEEVGELFQRAKRNEGWQSIAGARKRSPQEPRDPGRFESGVNRWCGSPEPDVQRHGSELASGPEHQKPPEAPWQPQQAIQTQRPDKPRRGYSVRIAR